MVLFYFNLATSGAGIKNDTMVDSNVCYATYNNKPYVYKLFKKVLQSALHWKEIHIENKMPKIKYKQ